MTCSFNAVFLEHQQRSKQMLNNFDLGDDFVAVATDLGTDKEEMIIVCSITKVSIVLDAESLKKLREIFKEADQK